MTNLDSHVSAAAKQPALSAAAAVLAGLGIPLLGSSPSASGVALALALVLMVAAPGRGGLLREVWRGLRRPFGLALVAFFLLWLPAVIDSLEPTRSLGIWGRMVGFVIAAAIIYHFLRRSPAALRSALRALIAGVLVCAAIGLIGIYGSSWVYSLFRGHLSGAVDAAAALKAYGSAVACLIPVVLWAGFRLGRGWRIAGLAYVPLGVALMFAADSKAGLFGFIIAAALGVLLLLLWRLWQGRAVALFVIAVVALFGIALGIVMSQLPAPPEAALLAAGVYDGPLETPLPVWLLDAHRQQIWGFALHAALESPWIGHGIDVSNILPGAHTLIVRFNQEFIPSHPHSWLLEVFAETGAIGLAALVAVLALMIRRWLMTGATAGMAGVCGLALFGAFWGSSLLNFSLWAAWWQLTYVVLGAIVLAAASAAKPDSRTPQI